VRTIRPGLAIVAALSLGGAATAASPLSPDRIAAEIQAQGAEAVVQRLFKHGDYDRVLAKIDTGAASWVALAPKLAPGTDAGTAEALPIALAFALPKNPAAVLAVLDPQNEILAPDSVCGVPFIEDTVKDIPGYIKRARAMVSKVADPGLQAMKAACLAALKQQP
jgi:hypothetical protein